MISQFQLLSKIIDNKDYSVISLNNLTEDHFFNYQAEFKFIKNHYELYGTVPDKLTFLGHFPDFVADGDSWTEVTEPDNYLLEQIETDYRTSYIVTMFNELKPLIESGKQTEAIQYFKEHAENLPTTNALTCVDLMNNTDRYEHFLDRLENGSKYYLKTGFKELDRAIGGIDRENEDMLVVARTGKGKTWVLCIMAAAAVAQGLKVGFYSGEMSADKVGYRIDTILGKGRLNNKGLTRGFFSPYGSDAATIERDKQNGIQAYKDYFNDLEGTANAFLRDSYPELVTQHDNIALGNLFVITPNDIPGAPTVDALRGFIEKYKVDIMFVDQYSLLEDTSKAKVEHERVANISKAIKKLQVAKRIPFVSVSQQNRDKNEDGKQDTTQIAGSDRLGQDATTVLMLDREKMEETGEDILIINPQKVRDGGEGRPLKYLADFNSGIFTLLEEGYTANMDATSKQAKNKADNEAYN